MRPLLTNGWLGVGLELVAAEAAEAVGLAHAAVPDEHHLKGGVVVVCVWVGGGGMGRAQAAERWIECREMPWQAKRPPAASP